MLRSLLQESTSLTYSGCLLEGSRRHRDRRYRSFHHHRLPGAVAFAAGAAAGAAVASDVNDDHQGLTCLSA